MGDVEPDAEPCSGLLLDRRKASEDVKLPEMVFLCVGELTALEDRSFLDPSGSWLLVAAMAALMAWFGVTMSRTLTIRRPGRF